MRANRTDSGFTLVEMMVSITILGIIMLPLSTGVILGIGKLAATNQRQSDAGDTLVVSHYFTTDVQRSESVITDFAAPASLSGVPVSCVGGAGFSPVALFEWRSDPSTVTTTDSWSMYGIQTPTRLPPELIRLSCIGGANSSHVLATSLSTSGLATLTCSPACSSTNLTPATVDLTVTELSSAVPTHYHASRREAQ